MHELALARSLADLVEEEACRAGAARVRLVRVALGALGHVTPEAMRFCFDAATRGTRAEGAAFDIVIVPGQGRCESCGRAVRLAERFAPCPECGGERVRMTAGDELRLIEMEVE